MIGFDNAVLRLKKTAWYIMYDQVFSCPLTSPVISALYTSLNAFCFVVAPPALRIFRTRKICPLTSPGNKTGLSALICIMPFSQ